MMKRTRGDLKPGTVFRYIWKAGRLSESRAVNNLRLEGAPRAEDQEVIPSPEVLVEVVWEPGDSAQPTVKQDLFDGKTAEQCLEAYTRMMQLVDQGRYATGRIVRLTPLQMSVARNEWRRVLAEKIKASAKKEHEAVKVDLMFEEWE